MTDEKLTSKAITSEVRFTVRDKLVVGDPCYIDTDDGDTPEAVLADALPSGLIVALDDCTGDWRGVIDTTAETQGWGERVATLTLTRLGTVPTTRTTERVGLNGVDSGQMYAGCASTLPLDYEALLSAYRDERGEWQNFDCLAFGGGIVSATGYGDGVYPVEVRRDRDDRVAEVTVTFIGDEDDEDEDEVGEFRDFAALVDDEGDLG